MGLSSFRLLATRVLTLSSSVHLSSDCNILKVDLGKLIWPESFAAKRFVKLLISIVGEGGEEGGELLEELSDVKTAFSMTGTLCVAFAGRELPAVVCSAGRFNEFL
jgi:hypothetical protein